MRVQKLTSRESWSWLVSLLQQAIFTYDYINTTNYHDHANQEFVSWYLYNSTTYPIEATGDNYHVFFQQSIEQHNNGSEKWTTQRANQIAVSDGNWPEHMNMNNIYVMKRGNINNRVKYTLQPSTCTKVRFSTFNYETGQETPSNYQNRINLVLGWFQKRFSIFGGAEILYYFFEHLNVLKWKNSKLQSCRSHWELQLWYKKYFHLTPYK